MKEEFDGADPTRTPQMKWRRGGAPITEKADITFRYRLPRGAYNDLKPGQQITVLECTEELQKIRQRLYQAAQAVPHRYSAIQNGTTVYIHCLPPRGEKLLPADWKPQPSRSQQLAPVKRRRTTPPNRTPWIRNQATGAYECHDISPQARGRTAWELRPTSDPFWRWTVVRDGVPVSQSRTLADAKAEAEQLK